MEISTSNSEVIQEIVELLSRKSIIPEKLQNLLRLSPNQVTPEMKNLYPYLEYTPSEQIPGFKVIFRNLTTITLEYYETKPPHLREIFIREISTFSKILPVMNKILLSQLSGNSWFSILWNPMKSTSHDFISTSFITYYQFKFSEESLGKQTPYAEIPIIGILPIKFVHKIFLEKISKNYVRKIYDNLILKSSLENVTDIVLKNSHRVSIDVEYEMKNNKLTQLN